MNKFKLILVFNIIFLMFMSASAKDRIVVLPFQNMDGDMKFNVYCYKLQDSLYKALLAKDPETQNFQLVPMDSVEDILAEMNLEPTNPQYPTDLWKAVERLNVEKVIMGNFNFQAERFLINCYIYDVQTKLAYPEPQAKDIFKSQHNILESVKTIVKRLSPILYKE